jgi:hypothetical protein
MLSIIKPATATAEDLKTFLEDQLEFLELRELFSGLRGGLIHLEINDDPTRKVGIFSVLHATDGRLVRERFAFLRLQEGVCLHESASITETIPWECAVAQILGFAIGYLCHIEELTMTQAEEATRKLSQRPGSPAPC